MKSLVVGASVGFGRALSERLAAEGHALTLVATDARDLEAVAAHLRLKYGVQVDFIACRLTAEADWLAKLTSTAGAPENYDGLYFPIGVSLENDDAALDERATRDLVEANFLGIALIVSHFLPSFIARGTGQIIGFGSVAAARGRGANVIYAAAKRALASYFESLRHRLADTEIRVHFYQLGYLDTQQSFGKKLLFPKLPPDVAAAIVRRRAARPSATHYLPGFWRPIVWLVRNLPWAFFKRLRF